MHSVGEQLRRARLEKGISLEQAYKQTKIHTHVIEALEQDRAHNFLSFIYIKGFLRTYAQYLGLDGEKLLTEYGEGRKQDIPASEIVVKKKPKPKTKIKPALVVRGVSALVLLIVLAFYFRFLFKRIFHRPPQSLKPEQAQRVKVEVIPAPVIQDLVLEVKTLDDCWLRVRADNEIIFQKTLAKGKVEKWRANDEIELRIGKPEALNVELNGKPIDLKKAQVKKTLVITHKGIVGK